MSFNPNNVQWQPYQLRQAIMHSQTSKHNAYKMITKVKSWRGIPKVRVFGCDYKTVPNRNSFVCLCVLTPQSLLTAL